MGRLYFSPPTETLRTRMGGEVEGSWHFVPSPALHFCPRAGLSLFQSSLEAHARQSPRFRSAEIDIMLSRPYTCWAEDFTAELGGGLLRDLLSRKNSFEEWPTCLPRRLGHCSSILMPAPQVGQARQGRAPTTSTSTPRAKGWAELWQGSHDPPPEKLPGVRNLKTGTSPRREVVVIAYVVVSAVCVIGRVLVVPHPCRAGGKEALSEQAESRSYKDSD